MPAPEAGSGDSCPEPVLPRYRPRRGRRPPLTTLDTAASGAHVSRSIAARRNRAASRAWPTRPMLPGVTDEEPGQVYEPEVDRAPVPKIRAGMVISVGTSEDVGVRDP